MPRKAQAPRLVLFGPDRKYGAVPRADFKSYAWYIVWTENRRTRVKSTGAARSEVALANQRLEEFLERKQSRRPPTSLKPSEATVGWILRTYLDEYVPQVRSSDRARYAIKSLLSFWENYILDDVRGHTCREYLRWRQARPSKNSQLAREAWEREKHTAPVASRPPPPPWAKNGGDPAARRLRRAQMQTWKRRLAKIAKLPEAERQRAIEAMGHPPWEQVDWKDMHWRRNARHGPLLDPKPEITAVSSATVRAELECLRAAIHYCYRERLITQLVPVWMPPKGESRKEWLTRSEFARLLLAARERIPGQPTMRRHLIVYLMVGVYEPARMAAILSLPLRRPMIGGPWIDVERGRIDFGPDVGKKRRPRSVPIHPRLMVFVRGAIRRGQTYLIEYSKRSGSGDTISRPIKNIRRAFANAVARTGIEKRITPHTLRHTGITWLKLAGVSGFTISGYAGVSEEMIERVYGHHDPAHLQHAVTALQVSRRKG